MLPETPIPLCSGGENGTRWPMTRQPIVTKRIISCRITTCMYGFIEIIRPECWPHFIRLSQSLRVHGQFCRVLDRGRPIPRTPANSRPYLLTDNLVCLQRVPEISAIPSDPHRRTLVEQAPPPGSCLSGDNYLTFWRAQRPIVHNFLPDTQSAQEPVSSYSVQEDSGAEIR